MSFRQFMTEKIAYFVSHFRKNCLLLDHQGNQLHEIDLSFETLSGQFLNFCEQQQNKRQRQIQTNNLLKNLENNKFQVTEQLNSIKFNESQLDIKINDKDLHQFWNALTPNYELALNIQGQNISDQSILKLAELFQNDNCRFTKIKIAGNQKVTQIGILKLGQALRNNKTIKEINFHGLQIGSNGVNRIIELIGVTNISCLDLGLITNQSLKYLASNLENVHALDSIWFGQSIQSDKWKEDGKLCFQNVVRRCQFSKRLIAINLYTSQPLDHYTFISQLNIITSKNRKMKVDQRQNEFKAASLNPNHHSYYDPDNHNLNAYKFSVKSYLTNVFGSLLDQALYFLQKQRRNQLRDEATFQITQEATNKVILQDICTSDGSIIVLTKYLLGKIKQKQRQEGVASN